MIKTVPFAAYLGRRKPKAAKPTPAPKAAPAPKPKPKAAKAAPDFSHLKPAEPPPPTSAERSAERGEAARAAVASYGKATGQTASAGEGPRPGSPAERATRSYNRVHGRD